MNNEALLWLAQEMGRERFLITQDSTTNGWKVLADLSGDTESKALLWDVEGWLMLNRLIRITGAFDKDGNECWFIFDDGDHRLPIELVKRFPFSTRHEAIQVAVQYLYDHRHKEQAGCEHCGVLCNCG